MRESWTQPVQEIFPRLRELLTNDDSDLADAPMVIPRHHYTCVEHAALERRTVFADPIIIGATAQVREAGDFFTFTVLDTPLLVVRGTDGRVRVLLNACRHRGAQVAAGAGCARRFTCPYHAWNYDDTGTLVGQPFSDGFAGHEVGGLVEFPSEERHGFIWTVLDPEGSFDLDDHLGPLDADLAQWGYGDAEVLGLTDIDVDGNWKCSLEAFQETYHFPYVHRNSIIGQGVVSNVITFDMLGRHHRLGVPSMAMRDAMDEEQPEAPNLTAIYYMYPSATLAATGQSGEFLLFFPGGHPGQSHIRHIVLSRGKVPDELRPVLDEYIPAIQGVVRDEDGPVIESSGRGLAAGLVDVVLGRNEAGCQNAHRQVQARMGIACPSSPGRSLAED